MIRENGSLQSKGREEPHCWNTEIASSPGHSRSTFVLAKGSPMRNTERVVIPSCCNGLCTPTTKHALGGSNAFSRNAALQVSDTCLCSSHQVRACRAAWRLDMPATKRSPPLPSMITIGDSRQRAGLCAASVQLSLAYVPYYHTPPHSCLFASYFCTVFTCPLPFHLLLVSRVTWVLSPPPRRPGTAPHPHGAAPSSDGTAFAQCVCDTSCRWQGV